VVTVYVFANQSITRYYADLLKTYASRKQQFFEEQLVPALEWVTLIDNDWKQASQFWVQAIRAGKQLSDVDLLIASLAIRLDALIASADSDFDALPIRREDWRK
jgi:predicted nucleic acid-binding protein